MGLINREALLSFEKMDADLCASCGEHHTAEDVIMMIKTAPTVDAVPVVRCRECKHRYEDAWCEYVDDDDNFYCARGERKEVPTITEYVTKEQVIDWYRPYGQTDAPIPFETLVSDLRDMKTADVSTVRHGRWIEKDKYAFGTFYDCSICGNRILDNGHSWNYCPNCGAKMEGGSDNEP